MEYKQQKKNTMDLRARTLSSSSEEEDMVRVPEKQQYSMYTGQKRPQKRSESSSVEEEPKAKVLRTNSFVSESDSEWNKRSLSESSFEDDARARLVRNSFSSESEEDNLPASFKFMKTTADNSFISKDSKAQKMMEKMGYQRGKGLGKSEQGRVAPVELSRQRGRRGLGLHIKGLEPADIQWDSSLEVIEVEETVHWLEESDHIPIYIQELRTWIKEGDKKLSLDDESSFCDPDVLRNVLACKSIFDALDGEELRKARTKSNPFETIRGAFFLNRAAMKMANMDAVFDFMFTKPKDESGSPVLGPNDLLYFADVCAGPGGFSEYVLWRKKWESKGYGFTLKGENDFRLSEFFAGPCETFEPFYGVNGTEGDGDVYKPENIDAFQKFVLDNTDQKGVHFMMADGGFSVEGQENIQEILSKQLYLCQFLVALGIVRIGGHFVCKLFDVFTPFSVGLVYLMYKAFRMVSIHKPNTSRPANSERYIICKWKREDTSDIFHHLYNTNVWLCKNAGVNSNSDIVEVVPLHILQSDQDFFNYIVESNNSLGERQVINLTKIAAFCKDVNLIETRQADMKKQCLEFWGVEDKARTAPPRTPPDVKYSALMQGMSSGWMFEPDKELTETSMKESIKSVFDWRCVVVGSTESDNTCSFFLGMGREKIFQMRGGRWQKLDLALELSPDTLVYGEIVQELRGEGRSQRKIAALHIIDALFLGGIDIRHLHLKERHQLCTKFAKAVNKPSRPEYIPIRVKELFRCEDCGHIFGRLEMRITKKSGGMPRLVYCFEDEERFFIPGGVMFFNATKDPWTMAFSRSQQRKYWFNTHNRDSFYECPKESIADFLLCFKRRLTWWWDEGVQIVDSHKREKGRVHRDTLLLHIQKLLPQ